ncbi:nuclear transport factor 2 family protein [Pseudonocardia zijingensis]|uniref:SnoaL-like domain-containing protein n=1 Tax=Pseudonocardia zijingensis TaxID=153376 RepID=A0ABP4ABB7_9PSEU
MTEAAHVVRALATDTPTDTLTDAVQKVESVRDVKDVQRHYAHLLQVGAVAAAAELIDDDAVLRWGSERRSGRAEISAWLEGDLRRWGGARPGSLHTEIIDQPLVTLSGDGRTARGRWHGMRFLGDGDGGARIEAGIYENTYVRSSDGWKIDAIDFTPLYGGDHAEGWTNWESSGVPIVPRHFTADEAGAPVGAVVPVAGFGAERPDALAARIARLNDEDEVRNLLHAWGYYVDRRMWTDVVELFAEDGVISVDGVAYRGHAGVRTALEETGPEGLTRGELADRPIFDLIVDVRPGGDEAHVRGIAIGMLGDADQERGHWGFARFGGTASKRAGAWRIAELRTTTLLRADHAEGWGRGGVLDGARADAGAPPALSRRVLGPPGTRASAAAGSADDRLPDLERRLARSRAYDAVENISAAYGYYLDDFQWPEMARLFAERGHKQSPFTGYYVGRDRILEAAVAAHGPPKPADARRERAVFHWRPQSVVHVSHDGRSANLRTRLLQTRTAGRVEPEWTGLHSGCYPNDQAVLEDGVWRFWSITIDEYYFTSPTWEGGWAVVRGRGALSASPARTRLAEVCPPDIPMSELGRRMEGMRGGVGRPLTWPEIAPMWFSYRNPVSGRVPERYWPDCVPSGVAPDTSMTRHGYQLPPTDPE